MVFVAVNDDLLLIIKDKVCDGTGVVGRDLARQSVPVLNSRHYDELVQGLNGLRYGLSVTVDTADGATEVLEVLEVLNVDLKSGCFVDDYEKSDRKACPTFSKQAVWLDKWFENKEAMLSDHCAVTFMLENK